MKARDLMERSPDVVSATDRITAAAELMHYAIDAGIPVVRDHGSNILVGMITARDIAVRCVARRHPPVCTIREHMTPIPLRTVHPDDDIAAAAAILDATEVRRVPVVSPDGVLLGVIRERDVRRALRA